MKRPPTEACIAGILAAAALAGCGGPSAGPNHPPGLETVASSQAPSPQASGPLRDNRPPSEAISKRPAASGHLDRDYTGQAEPAVVVRNDYARLQYVFIDGEAAGQVSAGTQATFTLAAGAHTVSCSDSEDPNDERALAVTELFEEGYLYRYRVFGE